MVANADLGEIKEERDVLAKLRELGSALGVDATGEYDVPMPEEVEAAPTAPRATVPDRGGR